MKIAIVCYNLRWIGGGQRLLFMQAREMRKLGHQVTIFVPSTEYRDTVYPEYQKGLDIRLIDSPQEYLWKPPVGNLLMRLYYKWKKERWLVLMAKRMAKAIPEDFDAVNVHDFAYKAAYYYKKRNPHVKVVYTHNDPPYHYLPHPESFIYDRLSRLFNWIKDFMEAKYFRVADEVAVLDIYNKKWCEDRGMKVSIVRLGADVDWLYHPVKDLREQFGRKRVNLMSLGILNPYRRYQDSIEATRLLREWGYDARLIVICRDFWKRGDLRAMFEEKIKEGKLEPYMEFHYEGATEEELKDYFGKNDIFLHPMYLPPPRDGFGFSIGLTEAIASGLAVITCKTSTNAEVLRDNETAFLVDPMRPEQFAQKVKYLVDHPDEYRRIAASGQKFVKENLTWERFARQMEALCEK